MLKRIINSFINWFKEYGLTFHVFNWGLPAVLPIFAICIFFYVIRKLGLNSVTNSYLILLMNFTCQLFYFSFLLLINNVALYYISEEKKQNNYFTLSISFAILFLLFYIVATIFSLSNCENCGIKLVVGIFIMSVITSCVAIYLYSKNTKATFLSTNDESAKISEERKDKSKILEDRIKSSEQSKQ